MSLTRAITIAVCALVCALPAAAQDWKGQGRFDGRVLDSDGNPIQGATVKCELPQRGGGPAPFKTGKDGRWAIGGIAAGSWEVDIAADGFEGKKLTVTLPGEMARIKPVELKLEKAKAHAPALPPELTEAFKKAEEDYQAGRHGDAATGYEKVLSMGSSLPQESQIQLHSRAAECFSKDSKNAKALEHLQFVLDANPANTQLRAVMAEIALKEGLYDRGVELLKGLDEGAIKDPDLFFNVGVNFVNLGKPDDAILYFTKAITVNPAYVDGYFQRGLALLGQGKNAESKADMRKVLELAPPDSPQAQTAKKVIDSIK